ncbi:uncharacterized protein [Atheta coriaria]|uniref:uncharacterized protein isoform X1 n=1 Tax=Dalotia coriaria TaxID=877792 RepID=UPI0031F35452
MMLIRRIKCDLLTMMAMAILVTHSATETEARPQLQHQPQQPAHSEEAFFPEPSVHYLANGYPHLVRTYYNYPLFDRKRLRMQQMQRAWNYEDPENYLIDSFMSAVADGHIKQHQTTTTTTTIKPTTTTTSKDAKTPVKITLLPFYGGAKGQTLQITENLDGTVSTEVLQGQFPAIEPEGEEEEAVEAVENPVLPVRRESDYGQNIKNIHRSALNIIRLQEAAKTKD